MTFPPPGGRKDRFSFLLPISASRLHSVQSLLQINLEPSHPLSTGPRWDLKEGGMSFIHFKDYIVFHHIVLNKFSIPGIFVVTK